MKDEKEQSAILAKMRDALDKAPNVIEFRGLNSPDVDEIMLFFWTDNDQSAVWNMTKEQGVKLGNKILEMSETKGRIII